MKLEFQSNEAFYGENFHDSSSGITREKIMQLIAAGILFPDEIRRADQILRHMNAKTG